MTANEANRAQPMRIGDYQVERQLGQGGMATVFLAKSPNGRAAALKVMLPHLVNDAAFMQRFVQEARSSVGLKHPNIVEVLSFGEQEGQYFIASEFVDGGTVEDLLKKAGKFPAPLATELLGQLLEAVGYAHSKGVVHRDLKPANLMLTRAGVLKVGDFGIAKTVDGAALTQTGIAIGTPAYMSPEQASGRPVDARSDLFSVGLILFEFLSGLNPHASENPATSISRLLQASSPNIYETEPTVPAELEKVLENLLEKEPAKRPASAKEVLDQIQPLRQAVKARYPRMVTDFLENTQATEKKLREDQAATCLTEAKELLKQGPVERRRAALSLYRAVLLNPTQAEAQGLFQELCATEKINFGAPANPKIAELEKLLEIDPNSPGVLQQLAQLYRMEGNLYKAVTCFKKYLRLRPKDGYVATQLSQLTGQKLEIAAPPGPVSAQKTELPSVFQQRTGALVSGVKTGGLQASRPVNPTGPASVQSAVPSPPSSEVPEEESPLAANLQAFWNGIGKKLVVVGVAAGGLYFVVQKMGGFVDTSSKESQVAFDKLSAQKAAEEQVKEDQQANREAKARAEQSEQESATRLEEALGLYRKGDYEGALREFDALEERFPKRKEASRARFYQGKSLVALGRKNEALGRLSNFIQVDTGSPDWAEALLLRGQAHAALGNPTSAVADFTTLLTKQAVSPFATEAYLSRAEAYAAMEKGEDAAADFRQVLGRVGPSDPLHQKAEAGLEAVSPSQEKPRR